MVDFIVLKKEIQTASESVTKSIKLFDWLETHEQFYCCLCQERFALYYIFVTVSLFYLCAYQSTNIASGGSSRPLFQVKGPAHATEDTGVKLPVSYAWPLRIYITCTNRPVTQARSPLSQGPQMCCIRESLALRKQWVSKPIAWRHW